MEEAGYLSAYREVHGNEPASTWPTGLVGTSTARAPFSGCLDYIWLLGAVRPVSARLAYETAHPDDATLYSSDHCGVLATLAVGSAPPS